MPVSQAFIVSNLDSYHNLPLTMLLELPSVHRIIQCLIYNCPCPQNEFSVSQPGRSLVGYSPWGRMELGTTEATACTCAWKATGSISRWSCRLSHFSHVWLFETLWIVALQATLSMELSGKWSRLPFPYLGVLSNPRIKSKSLCLPGLEGKFFTTRATWSLTPKYPSFRYNHSSFFSKPQNPYSFAPAVYTPHNMPFNLCFWW